MDEKTAELRDIFLDTTDSEGMVTERQAERRGSLVDVDDDATVDERLRELVTTMQERGDFETDLDTGTYVDVIRAFYDGATDDAIAETVGVDGETATQARLDCHLVRDDDPETPPVEASQERAVRVNHRFRDAFTELLTDDDLSTRLASDSREDGLREATEDIETNVSF